MNINKLQLIFCAAFVVFVVLINVLFFNPISRNQEIKHEQRTLNDSLKNVNKRIKTIEKELDVREKIIQNMQAENVRLKQRQSAVQTKYIYKIVQNESEKNTYNSLPIDQRVDVFAKLISGKDSF